MMASTDISHILQELPVNFLSVDLITARLESIVPVAKVMPLTAVCKTPPVLWTVSSATATII